MNPWFSENTFYTSGEDARIRKWSKDEETWRIAAVANYRNDSILNFDISADKQLGKRFFSFFGLDSEVTNWALYFSDVKLGLEITLF